ncbi:MAG: helix-turn-helix transcriptional regulator [Thiothrix sp.]|nr:helix-turn-helix transcriptional regulator [Thiothrix sp.]
MSIGQRLKEERLKTGLSQERFASIAGTTKKSQIDYETDKTQPKAGYFEAIHNASLGVDILYILTNSSDHHSKVDHYLSNLSEDENQAIKLIVKSLALKSR